MWRGDWTNLQPLSESWLMIQLGCYGSRPPKLNSVPLLIWKCSRILITLPLLWHKQIFLAAARLKFTSCFPLCLLLGLLRGSWQQLLPGFVTCFLWELLREDERDFRIEMLAVELLCRVVFVDGGVSNMPLCGCNKMLKKSRLQNKSLWRWVMTFFGVFFGHGWDREIFWSPHWANLI